MIDRFPHPGRIGAGSAGLRNRIAQEYDEIDAGQVYAAIKSAKADVPEYIRAIEEFLKRN